VEDPEELDTRFSKFAPSIHDDEEDVDDVINNLADGADDVLDLFKKLHASRMAEAGITEIDKEKSTSVSKETVPAKV